MSSTRTIPFCIPYQAPNEAAYIAKALDEGVRSGDGSFSRRSRALLSGIAGGATFLTTSGTAALELAILVAGIGPGDEVIVPSFTFTSVANSVALRGATPVFVDIDPDTLNLDPVAFEAAISPRTRAVIAMHYAGVVCDMDRILEVARRQNIIVIEDAAHAIGSTRGGRPAGSFGDLAAFSFHYTKNITCGEGGALVVNDSSLLPRTEIVFEKGTNRSDFSRGVVDKYSWIDIGGSFTLGELNAAMLTAQLEALVVINTLRLEHWARYKASLAAFVDHGIRLPAVGPGDGHNAHLFYLLLPSAEARSNFIATMQARGMTTPFHYVPLHASPAGRRFGYASGPLPVTEDLAGRLVRLPLYPQLGEAIDEVIAAAGEWAQGQP